MAAIDINSDMGESFGAWNMGDDALLMQNISSANIACGFHAGDPDVMLETVRCAVTNNVAIGVHPGLPDLQGFGRREMALTPSQVYALTLYQVGALNGIVRAQGTRLHHVKTHGALYGMTSRRPDMARAVAQAVYDIDPTLSVYVANPNMEQAVRELGLPVVCEVYADRSYQDDGTLTPRGTPGAMIEDVEQAIAQVLQMVQTGTVMALSGKKVKISADTLCIHGDQPGAAKFAARIRTALLAEGIQVRAPE